MTQAAPTSPCINVCVLDQQRTCTGCYRTLDEIARWGSMSAAEQWVVIARLESVRQQVDGGVRRSGSTAV